MPVLEKWTPFRELDLFDRRMRRFFSDLGVAPAITPAADIYESGGSTSSSPSARLRRRTRIEVIDHARDWESWGERRRWR
jgi:hypothetical protein